MYPIMRTTFHYTRIPVLFTHFLKSKPQIENILVKIEERQLIFVWQPPICQSLPQILSILRKVSISDF